MKTPEFKGTPGNWEIIYVSGIPIGIGTSIERVTFGNYLQVIANSVLPNTDEEWETEKEETTANMKLIAAAPDLLKALQECLLSMDEVKSYNLDEQRKLNAKKAIEKALL